MGIKKIEDILQYFFWVFIQFPGGYGKKMPCHAVC